MRRQGKRVVVLMVDGFGQDYFDPAGDLPHPGRIVTTSTSPGRSSPLRPVERAAAGPFDSSSWNTRYSPSS